jgi:hypothetical protein
LHAGWLAGCQTALCAAWLAALHYLLAAFVACCLAAKLLDKHGDEDLKSSCRDVVQLTGKKIIDHDMYDYFTNED